MKAAATAALLAAAASPAGAALPAARFNPAAPENRQLLPAFSYATVEPVLAQIGARYRRAGASPEKPVLHVVLPNNRTAILSFDMCSPGGTACKSLSIHSEWTRIANSPPERTEKAIDGFNRSFAFAKAFVAPGGKPWLQRYLTADYGFVRGNLAVNLLVFAEQAESFAVKVLRPLEARR
jgi:hypothetical protein